MLTPAARAPHRIGGAPIAVLAALFVALSALPPTAAHAQEETVSNLTRPAVRLEPVGNSGSGSNLIETATSFRTGNAAAGYNLRQIRINFGANITGNPSDIVVAVHAQNAAGNNVGAVVGTLSGPARPTRFATYTATDLALAAGTTYYLVLSAPGSPSGANNHYNASGVTNISQSGSPGWAIGDRILRKQGSGNFAPLSIASALRFEVTAVVATASVIATPGARTVAETGARNNDTYTLALGSAPTADVVVTPSIAPAGVATFAPATLTFTSANWITPQNVTLTAVNDDIDNPGDQRTATVSHAIATTDAAYGAIAAADLPTVTLTVTDDDATPALSASATTLTLAEMGGTGTYTLELTTAPTADVEVTPSITPATGVAAFTPATLTFTSANWDTAQTVSVTATDDDVDNTGDQRTATITHAVATTDAIYTALTDLPEVAITVTDDDDSPPGAPQNVEVDTMTDAQITVTWTAPTSGGTIDNYEICIVEVSMEVNNANCTGSATATVTAATTTHTRTGLAADANYNVGVRSMGPGGTSAWAVRRGGAADARITTDSGAAIARAIAGIANAAIAGRIAQATAGGGFNLADSAGRTAQHDAGGNFTFADSATRLLANGGDIKPMLDGTVLALSGGSRASAAPSFWASGDYRDIGGGSNEGGETTDWDGEVLSIQLGADARLPNGILLGAAASRSRSDIDYTADDGSTSSQEVTLTSLHPYIAHRTRTGASLWATLARGEGELDRKPDSGEATTNDVTLSGIAVGASGVIGRSAHSEWRLLGEVQTAEMTFDGAAADGGDLDVTASRARFGAQWSDAKQLADATLRRALSFHLRHDDGDGITGRGFELAARIARADANGVTASAHARALLTHNRDYDEWGVGAQVRYAPGADGQGFSVRMEPSLGATDSRADELLHGEDALADQSFDPTARVDGEIGYGIALNQGVMTPYSGFRFADGGRDWRVGARYKLRPIPLEMGLEAYRNERDDIENGVLLEAHIRW